LTPNLIDLGSSTQTLNVARDPIRNHSEHSSSSLSAIPSSNNFDQNPYLNDGRNRNSRADDISNIQASGSNGNSMLTVLEVVDPVKHVFVSRFKAETTADNVVTYVKEKLNDSDVHVSVLKFRSSANRQISSFKISIPPHIFERVNSHEFWPPNAVVHEFESQRIRHNRLRATQPRSSQKN